VFSPVSCFLTAMMTLREPQPVFSSRHGHGASQTLHSYIGIHGPLLGERHLAPAAAICRAISAPMPDPAPVTMAVIPFMSLPRMITSLVLEPAPPMTTLRRAKVVLQTLERCLLTV
jgi:hypothetical protein